MDFLFHPTIFWPLLFDLAMGCIGGAFSGRIIWRLLTWFIVPLAVAVVVARPQFLFAGSGEERGWAMLTLFYLAPHGFVACGMGVSIGYLFRRVIRARSASTHDT
jgi:hypothetical protein